MKNLYIISGCNGAGKTTVSYTILPEILNCQEFVNADEIAKGLSPFNPESTSIQAGRLMLVRINDLLEKGQDFAFETTLSTRSYFRLVERAHKLNYSVTLLFFYLNSDDLAVERVKTRVKEGGHNIPTDVIRRRYKSGLNNFFELYKPIVDDWMFIDNSGEPYQVLAEGTINSEFVLNDTLWTQIKDKYNGE